MKSATMLPNEVKSPFISFLRSFISSLAKRLHFFIRPAGATSLKKPRLSTRFFHGSGGRIRLHFVFPCGRRENKINVFTSVRAGSCTVRLAVPGECCGLTLFLAFSDRCGKCKLAFSATGSASSHFPPACADMIQVPRSEQTGREADWPPFLSGPSRGT